jgi:hypothetical protein
MGLHMQGWVVEETIMRVVEASCNEHGVVVVGNCNAQGKDVVVMGEYIEMVDVEKHILAVVVWKKRMVVVVGLDALHKVVMVTDEVLQKAVEIDMVVFVVVNEQGNEGAMEVVAVIGHNEGLSVVVNTPAEKSVLVVERKVALQALVERKVMFLVVVKDQGNEVDEMEAVIGHNEDLLVVVVKTLAEKSALVVERKVALPAMVERKVLLLAVVKKQGNVGAMMVVNELEEGMNHNENQEMAVNLVAEMAVNQEME